VLGTPEEKIEKIVGPSASFAVFLDVGNKLEIKAKLASRPQPGDTTPVTSLRAVS
jgi:hypothetical protein